MATSVKIEATSVASGKKAEVMVIEEGKPPQRRFLQPGQSTTVTVGPNSSIRVNEADV